MSRRGQALTHFFTLQPLATDNGQARSVLPARATGRLLLGGGGAPLPVHRVSGSKSRRLRTHINLGWIVRNGHGRSGVPWSSTRLRQHGLAPTSREDQSGKRALETLCHTKDRHRIPRTMSPSQQS